MSEHAGAETAIPGTHMSQLLTFMIADVRGYTRFTYEHGDEAAARLAEQFALLAEEVVAQYDGQVIELRGDEVLAVFSSARGALRASLTLQARLAEERDRTGLPLNAGIGLDAGEGVSVREGFRGMALNLAARLCSLAGPGDILATENLTRIARDPDDLVCLDRGQVTLKGFPEPVRVMQVVPGGASTPELPPLQAGGPTRPSNLPVEPTPFIGRRAELDDVLSLVHRPAARLISLTGTGGTGKTRLALQIGASLLDEFPDGVFFVSLASVTDPDRVAAAISQTLGLPEEAGVAPESSLQSFLRDKELLLVLDNFEQVRDAGTLVSRLLATCRGIKVLVTTRAVLNQYGEYIYEVPPLSVPAPHHLPDPASFLQYESVALFLERARAVKAAFEVTDENAPAIAEICRRLDGLPLAIELAAARIRILPPHALMSRLDRRMSVLTGGFGGRPERHQTLRATIEWSYDLLNEEEQRLFARLSVFVGGCDLEAIDAVCNADAALQADPLDSIVTLVENSLLRQIGDEEPRFTMLETIREYALGRLEEGGIAEPIRAHHAIYFGRLGEAAEPELRGPAQGEWLRRLDAEHDNVRASLSWFLEQDETEAGLRLAGALWRFWWGRGYLAEGRSWLERLLAAGKGSPESRAAALNGLANIVWSQGDLDRAAALHREALALRELVVDRPGIARSLNNIGLINEERGKFADAAAWYERALAVARQSGDPWVVALVLGNLGGVMGTLGRDDRAAELEEESLRLWRQIGDRASEGRVLNSQVDRALKVGDHHRAAALQRESLELNRGLGNQEPIAHSLEGAALILIVVGKMVEGVHLYAAADALRQRLGQPLPREHGVERDGALEKSRAALGQDGVRSAWTQGLSLTLDEAEEYALRELAGL